MTILTKEQIGNLVGSFTWNFCTTFFIEAGDAGNLVWSDPEYGGTGEIRPFHGTYQQWIKTENIPFGRDKGTHIINDYCGEFTYNSNTIKPEEK
jgi:hypothetical protein